MDLAALNRRMERFDVMKHVALVWLMVGCGAPTAPPSGPCSAETRADTFTPGLERAGKKGLVRVQLLEADPNPPAKGDNQWKIRVMDSAGGPVDGATISTKAFMPDHQHGSTVKTVSTPSGNGEYVLAPVNLFMPAYWEVSLELGGDLVVFSFCVEG